MLEDDNCNEWILDKISVADVKECSDRWGLFDISRYSRLLSFENIFDSTFPLKLLKETYRATNELCRNSPICPVNLLWSRRKSCKDGIVYTQDGTVPFNKLPDKMRDSRLKGIWVKFVVTSGSCPMKLLYERSKSVSPVLFRRDHGHWPPKLLYERSKSVICVRFERNVVYDEPMKLHPPMYNCFKDLRLLIKLGKSIGKSVSERVKDLRGVLQLYLGREPVRL